MRKLEEWERHFNSVGWFIPPYIQMGHLASLASAIRASNGSFTQDELEGRMAYLYEPIGVAAMVCDRYPITPVISEYRQTIAEAVAAHFAGLHHTAVAGLIPVIEGAGRELLNVRGEGAPKLGVRKVFATLASNCLNEVRRQQMGDMDEIESMFIAFESFTRDYIYTDSSLYSLADKTNRHGITHGRYRDSDYGRPLNFYKTISAVDFLTFISSLRANLSWFAPTPTTTSLKLAAVYEKLARKPILADFD
ncbi:hypothetical protein HGP17_30265 [Rhizobium sp. P38BS-XIX]|uniref:hypothetical protein n=1 Tax=Rhizobium sp. P38BS-XIX TaxID=2726740 RepID=UPI001456461B|nr:hypothetical protein [Rhizobium sp. P38BS-XIX]NLS01138.1 hypothetical protein [Rhizobium sp. P38BS-XIX]